MLSNISLDIVEILIALLALVFGGGFVFKFYRKNDRHINKKNTIKGNGNNIKDISISGDNNIMNEGKSFKD